MSLSSEREGRKEVSSGSLSTARTELVIKKKLGGLREVKLTPPLPPCLWTIVGGMSVRYPAKSLAEFLVWG